jgi:serine/threonine-protein kinase
VSDQAQLDATLAQAPDPLDAGLAAAFGPDSGPPLPAGDSVLKALGAVLPQAPRLHLRDADAGDIAPIVRPRSPEMPEGHDPAGRLQLHGEIARGGMGAVLQGRDTDLGRDVAVKVLLEAHAGKAELLQRFVEEAQIAGQLQHPGVVPVYELGQFPDRRPYFTMKLVKGQTLARLLNERKDPQQDRGRFLKVFEQVCQALAYAHARGVIHRDLKPANVMVGAFGEVQVMDWGLAKVLHEGGVADEERARLRPPEITMIRTLRSGSDAPGTDGSQTHAGSVLGTPAYMAPEQALGDVEHLDERCDVFGLGAILCEILTGEPPYTGGDGAQLHRRAARADLGEAFARLDVCGADFELAALAKRCLAPEPGERPRSAGALAAELTAYLESVEQRLRDAELAGAEARARALEERKRRRLSVALAVSVLLMVALGAGGWAWMASERAGRDRAVLARQAEQERHVQDALASALTLREQARAATDLGKWAEALAAARRAEALAESAPVPHDLTARVKGMLRELADEEADRRLSARMEEVHILRSDTHDADGRFAQAAALSGYRDAFRTVGLEVNRTTPAEAAARIRKHPHARAALIGGLDGWLGLARWAKASEAAWLGRILAAADHDPWRTRLRQAHAHRDADALRRLAGEVTVAEQRPGTLLLLSYALRDRVSYNAAAELLLRAQQRYPADFWINHDLAEALRRGQPARLPEALRFISVAAALRPDSAAVQYNLAGVLMDLGRRDEAVIVYRRALAQRPDFAGAHAWLGSALVRLGKLDQGIASCDRAIKLRPDFFEAHNIRGDALRLKGRLSESEAACRRAIELRPDFPLAYNNLGNVLLLLKRPDEASAAYRKALELQPTMAIANMNLGLIWKRQGQPAKAVSYFRKALAGASAANDPLDRAACLFYLGNALFETGDMEAALTSFQDAAALNPNVAEPHYNIGLILQKQSKQDAALAAFRKAVERNKDYAEAHVNIGSLLVDREEWDAARLAFEAAIHSRPNYAKAYNNLGFVLRRLERFDEAVEAIRQAIRLNPDDANWHLNLGHALKMKGQFAEALAAFRRGQDLSPGTPQSVRPTGQWITDTKMLLAMDKRLPAVLGGKTPLVREVEWRVFADACRCKGLHAAGARFFERAVAQQPQPADGLGSGLRYHAACAAARAGCRRDGDLAHLEEEERVGWRNKALAWLRADLTAWGKRLQDDRVEDREQLRQRVGRWRQERSLAGVREAQALARLPATERQAWERLWADVAALLERAGAKAASQLP